MATCKELLKATDQILDKIREATMVKPNPKYWKAVVTGR
jgi:hypothetical protein